jgi:hypothetical protein
MATREEIDKFLDVSTTTVVEEPKTPADDQPPPDDSDAPSDTDDSVPPPDESGDGTSDANDAPADSSNADAPPEGDSETDQAGEDGNTDPTPPKKGSARERIQELVDERDSYRSFGEYAQEQIQARDKRLAEIEAELNKLRAKPATAQPAAAPEADDPIPTLDDPDVQYDPARLQQKLAKWREDVKTKAAKVAESARTKVDPQAENLRIIAEFNRRCDEYAETHPTFKDKARLLPQLSADASVVVIKNPAAPAILDYLANNLKEAVRIVKLSPAEQIMELGEIRSKLPKTTERKVIPPSDKTPPQDASRTPAKPKSQSNAPPPPRPVRGGSRHDEVPITDPNLSMADFVRRSRAEKMAKRENSRKFRESR